MGTPDFAVAPLRCLVESGYRVVGVVTMPDKPAGRGLHMQSSPIKQYATEAGLKVLQPVKLKDPDFVEEFRALHADLGVVIAFRMLPEVIWSMPRLGTFNLHASLLPQYRGAAPINWAIINGERESGVTTFLLNHEIDKGALLGQVHVPITPDDTAGTLHDKLMEVGTALVVDTVEQMATGAARPIDQLTLEKGVVRDAPKIFKETCRIDWSRPVQEVVRLVRGLSPYPAAWSELWRENEPPMGVKIFGVHAVETVKTAAEVSTTVEALAGTIRTDGRSVMQVACADGWVAIDEMQLSGKRRMTVDLLLRGFRIDGARMV